MPSRRVRYVAHRAGENLRSQLRRFRLDAGRGSCLVLCLLAVSIATMVPVLGVNTFPTSMLVLPLMLGVLMLRLSQLRLLVVVAFVGAAVDVFALSINAARIGVLVLIVLVALISDYTVSVRERLGIVGTRGDSMLGELRDRMIATSGVAELPDGWRMEVSSKASGGTAFGGDFLVSVTDDDRWEIVLVDVSGKGIEAGIRALQLTGALGGLLGAIAPERFLSQANRYLLRQNWEEGFATAVHLALDVGTGRYEIRSAGHPPVARFSRGTGEWTLADAEGSALGFVHDPRYVPSTGVLHSGDALLLYTDGLIEIPGRDLSIGIDKLLGEATRLVVGSFEGGSARLLRRVAPSGTDDRAVVLLWRP
jgi:hypothetical protein